MRSHPGLNSARMIPDAAVMRVYIGGLPLWEREQHGHRRSVQAEAAATAAAKAAGTTTGPP
jgi:hypothetical protein